MQPSTSGGPETAISTNATCRASDTLDPLSAHFFGWFEYDDEMADPTLYKPENEGLDEYAGRSPAYYGVPTASIREMAELVAEIASSTVPSRPPGKDSTSAR